LITRDKTTPIDVALINDCIAEFDLDAERLDSLRDYYVGESPISIRERTTGLPNNKLMHNFAAYIATMTSGYLIGDPVQYTSEEKGLEAILDAYAGADVGSIDAEIALSQAIFGRGVELVYANSNAEPRTASLDPQNAFVVYSDDAECKPLFGVYKLIGTDSNGNSVVKKVYVYTDSEVIEYSAVSIDGTVADEVKRENHNFPHVPLVEYWNNSSQIGDFENVTTLIDAYDVLQSDRLNDKEQFADALLVLTGVVGFDTTADDTRSAAVRLKEEGTLSLPDVGAKAEYLTKSLNEADTDVLRAAIKSDIHKFSMVPDLSDENFAGNSSGVAMKYKLLGLEQLTKIKERWFREGLRWRLRLFAGFLSIKGKPKIDADKVGMVFRRSLPVNDAEIATMVRDLKDIVPDNLLLAQVPFVEDVQQAMDDLKAQRTEATQAEAAAFGAYPNANDEEVPGSDAVVEQAEDVTGKTLNGAQTQSLLSVVSQYASKALTLGQAINIISISIGVTKEEAKKLLEGALE
jgi:SPP1 family phage portal protein